MAVIAISLLVRHLQLVRKENLAGSRALVVLRAVDAFAGAPRRALIGGLSEWRRVDIQHAAGTPELALVSEDGGSPRDFSLAIGERADKC